jgi:hypothetical protein
MIWLLSEFLVSMTTVALTRCAYGFTLPAGVNNVWTTALRCWANRKSCHVLTLREGSHPLINYEKTEKGLLQSGSKQVFWEAARHRGQGKQAECISTRSQQHTFVFPSQDLAPLSSAALALWSTFAHGEDFFLLCMCVKKKQQTYEIITSQTKYC